MKYRVGDIVLCEVEVRASGHKYVLTRPPYDEKTVKLKEFQIIRCDPTFNTYTILIDEDIIGWTIGEFHVQHMGIAKAFKNKKFWDVTEDYIVKKK